MNKIRKYTYVFQLPNPLNPAPLRRKTPALHRFSGSVLRIPLRKSSFSRIRRFYLLNTDEIGSWEILYEDSVRMHFTVKEANAIQPPSEKPSKPKSKAGVLRKGEILFYRDSKGKIRKKAGFVT